MVNTQELQQKIQEVLSDEAFVKELLQMEDAGDVQKALEEKGIELSLNDIRRMGGIIQKVRDGEISQEQVRAMADGELSEDELEEVAGGCDPLTLIIISFIGGLVIGGGGIAGFATGWSW